jgi:hypothetical protein
MPDISRSIVSDTKEERIEYDSRIDETFHYRKDYLYNNPDLNLYSMSLVYSHYGKSSRYSQPPTSDTPDTVSDCKGVACSLGRGLTLPSGDKK